MPNDTDDIDDIEQIAPMPWQANGRAITDAHGKMVCVCNAYGFWTDMIVCRDRIIACVNFCKGKRTRDLEQKANDEDSH